MNDIKTLIKSSLISLIIVILGLFVLCMNRSPKLNFDGTFSEGEGIEAESDELSDNEFLSLLESSDNEILGDEDFESTSEESFLEDDFSEDNEADDEDLSEILKLLNMDEGESSNSETGSEEDSNELEKLLSGVDSETDGIDEKVDASTIDNLETEIGKLENILDKKNTKIDSIKEAIEEYDEQIAQFNTSGNYPGGATENNSSVKFTSYVKDGQASSDIENSEFSSASTFHGQYDIALSYFHNNQYKLAALAFEKLLQEKPYHELADNCQYWIGECQFARGNYYQAIVEFEKVFSFEAIDKKDDAQLMLGLAHMKAGKPQEAKTNLSWFLSCYQTSEYYPTAQRYLREL